MLGRIVRKVNRNASQERSYCTFAYSALASFRMGMSRSASFRPAAHGDILLESVCTSSFADSVLFTYIQSTADFEIQGESFQNSSHHSRADPLLKSSMASLVRRITLGNVCPRSACAQHPQNAVQDGPPILPRSSSPISATCRFWNKLVQNVLLCIGQVSATAIHCLSGDMSS
jgi:hypothetical protein